MSVRVLCRLVGSEERYQLALFRRDADRDGFVYVFHEVHFRTLITFFYFFIDAV